MDITNGKFVFQCTEAYLIEDGKVTAPVKGATLIGDGPSALKHIRRDRRRHVASTPASASAARTARACRSGVGQPSLLITGLTVGGSAA